MNLLAKPFTQLTEINLRRMTSPLSSGYTLVENNEELDEK